MTAEYETPDFPWSFHEVLNAMLTAYIDVETPEQKLRRSLRENGEIAYIIDNDKSITPVELDRISIELKKEGYKVILVEDRDSRHIVPLTLSGDIPGVYDIVNEEKENEMRKNPGLINMALAAAAMAAGAAGIGAMGIGAGVATAMGRSVSPQVQATKRQQRLSYGDISGLYPKSKNPPQRRCGRKLKSNRLHVSRRVRRKHRKAA